ncbi:MAG: TlpA disulfide reductase family protein [Pseudomonadota bacterium]
MRNSLIIGLALVLGMAAGAVFLYGIGGLSGNGEPVAQADACALSDTQKANLKAAATGDVATMVIADKPVPLETLAFEGASGEPMTLKDWSGKVVLLNVWATWCGPCREEMPDLAELQEKKRDQDFEVLALNVDRNGGDRPARFLDEINANILGLYLDPQNKSFQVLRSKGLVFGLPATMLIDEAGCVQGVMSGIARWASDDAKNLIEVAKQELKGNV